MSANTKFALPDNLIQSSQGLMKDLQEDTEGFERLARMLKSIAGINLPPNAKNFCLLASRLSPDFRKHGISTYQEYEKLLKSRPETVNEFICAMTTNTTQFFREPKHFEIFTDLLKDRIIPMKEAAGNRELRVWCAASSTGQEPYTILMTLLDALPNPAAWNIKFLATDIDREVLARASAGAYSESEVASLPKEKLQKYFTRQVSRGAPMWVMNRNLRELIRFAEFNLLTEQYPFQHKFDVAFCRNVLIYFDKDTSTTVVNKIAQVIRPGGYLFLGHSESGMMKSDFLKPIAAAAYERTGDAWKK